MCGKRSATATRNCAIARWKAPCEVSSEPVQRCVSSTRNERGSAVLCARSSASAANGAPPSPPRRPCVSFEVVATSRFECWWPSCSSGSPTQRSAICRVSRCFSVSGLSSARKPASDTACATCCHAAGSPIQSDGIAPFVMVLASSQRTEQRCRSSAFCASFASSTEASASWPAPRPAPFLPRPRPLPPTSTSCFFITRSAAQRRKKTATLAAMRASRPASWSFFCSFAFVAGSLAFRRLASAAILRAASVSRSTTRGLMPSSTRGQAWRSAKIRQKDSSSARSQPLDCSSRPIRASSEAPISSMDWSSTAGRSEAQRRPSAGCASSSSGLNGRWKSRILSAPLGRGGRDRGGWA
mmetsp:Transcript_97883/g.253192  ORF Transcript_97883/g.253192 Transcript_97883/m.253192 type:complete len:355 (+) Transcript_97883:4170-5234(+)